MLLDHFQFFAKVKTALSSKALPVQLKQTGTAARRNVSTSCSTPASQVTPDYERISGISDDLDEETSIRIGSSGRLSVQSETGSVGDTGFVKSDKSSEESPLLSFSGKESENDEDSETFYRYL